MENHAGFCRTLAEALNQLLPNKFDLQSHRNGVADECFRSLILQLVKKAASENALAMEYALICQKVKELFEPEAKDKEKNNFVYLLTNQCQMFFTSIRNNKLNYISHKDYTYHDEALQTANNHETHTQLETAQKTRLRLRELAIGTINFIAQLFNVGFFNCRVIELCMESLLPNPEKPNEFEIELFCILIKITGKTLQGSPGGPDIINKFLVVLEAIIDDRGESFEYQVRCLIFDVFTRWADNWETKDPDQSPESKLAARQYAAKVEALRETREFLTELDEVLGRLSRDKLLSFMYRFMDAKYNEDRLEGAVKIIFEHAIASSHISMYSMVCKGLTGLKVDKVDDQGDRVLPTFKDYLLRLIRHEIDVIRQKTGDFRSILSRMATLKQEIKSKAEKLKKEIENDFKAASRAANFAAFIGELYNANFIESRFIFDEVFIVFVDPKYVSDVTIESFFKLLKTCGIKMMTEKNRDILLKDTLTKLLEAADKIKILPKTKFLIKDIISFCRIQLKLPMKFIVEEDLAQLKQVNFQWSSRLETSTSPNSIKAKRNPSKANESENKFEAGRFIPGTAPLVNTFNKVQPNHVSQQTYALHKAYANYVQNIPKRLYMNSNTPNASNKFDAINNANDQNPIDFSKNYFNPSAV